jgi:hypothetical protein
VNELGYQLPFCQLLLSEGFTVIHNSKQNAFEQGKDIIAIAPDGVPCGFQLKGNNIPNKRWRDEVKGEIEALRDLTIVHPSINKSARHHSYLVTNGELEDTVRFEIENLNGGKWKDAPLLVVTYGELLERFIRISGGFAPQKIKDYKSFLDLYFSDGRELVDEKEFSEFITDILRLDDDRLSKEERKRSISAGVLFTGYLISIFKKQENQVSILQTLSLLSAHILAVAERYKLSEKYWLDSFCIVWNEMMLAGEHLQSEINTDGLANVANSMFDGDLGIYRKNLAVSHLLAYKTAQLIEGDPRWKDIVNDAFFLKLKDSLKVWGEAALFPFILVFFLTKKVAEEGKLAGDWYEPIYAAIKLILQFNGRRSETGMVSPYYGIETIIKRRFGLLEDPIDENFSGQSFLLGSLIDILARNGKRNELEAFWREITYITQASFIPEETWEHFLWRSDKGENKSIYPKQTQSWGELVREANRTNLEQVPTVIQNHPYFLPFFLLTYPHRITSNYSKFLADKIDKSV